jgi:hypothetical protein
MFMNMINLVSKVLFKTITLPIVLNECDHSLTAEERSAKESCDLRGMK